MAKYSIDDLIAIRNNVAKMRGLSTIEYGSTKNKEFVIDEIERINSLPLRRVSSRVRSQAVDIVKRIRPASRILSIVRWVNKHA